MLTDDLGTLRDVVDTSGTVQDHLVYTAFGQIYSESNASISHWQDFAFQHLDANTGMAFDGDRVYDPALGDWMQQDPKGFSAGDPNLSRYAGNAITGATDPSGLQGFTLQKYFGGPARYIVVVPGGSFVYGTGVPVIQTINGFNSVWWQFDPDDGKLYYFDWYEQIKPPPPGTRRMQYPQGPMNSPMAYTLSDSLYAQMEQSVGKIDLNAPRPRGLFWYPAGSGGGNVSGPFPWAMTVNVSSEPPTQQQVNESFEQADKNMPDTKKDTK